MTCLAPPAFNRFVGAGCTGSQRSPLQNASGEIGGLNSATPGFVIVATHL